MSNIVGEGFDEKIIGQVEQRQKIHGSITRKEETLHYLNNRSGWARLVSSVNVDASVAEQRGIDLSGSDLAKNYILFNGTPTTSGKPRSGIATDKSKTNNNAYGLGGLEFGLRPMPGIIQASVKTETRGSLKTATIQIEANNRTQFDVIDLLYMRLGYSMLLEWGHSSYYKNNGEYEKDNLVSLSNEFLSGELKYEDVYDEIQKRRLDSNGNYDAVFGKVVNFTWTFNPNGTYSITLILRSMGDVIESLKSNILLPGKVSTKTEGEGEGEDKEKDLNPTTEDIIASFKDAHSIGRLFYENQLLLEGQTPNEDKSTFYSNNKDFFSQQYEGGQTQYYIRLGYFLKWVENNIIPKTGKSSLIKFDTDVDSNIIHLAPYQVSTDPRICTFKSKFTNGDTLYSISGNAADFKSSYNSSTYGKIMNSYFNVVYILEAIKNLPNTPSDSNTVGLYDLLESLCSGWSKATGGYNSLEFKIEEETNTVKLIDSVALPDRDYWLGKFNQKTKDVTFEVYGYNKSNNQAGFIRDISFETTITNELATMITIGATKQGTITGQDSTALSRMNIGLTDRLKEKITSVNDAVDNTIIPEAPLVGPSPSGPLFSYDLPLEDKYKDVFSNFNKFIKTISYVNGSNKSPTLDVTAIDTYSSTLTQMIEYGQAKITEKAANNEKYSSSPNAGFLPFNLSLTMDGLSGIKVYQKYKMDTEYLPSNYPSSLEFLVSSITHNIVGNEWTTQLNSIAIPKKPFSTSVTR